MPLNPPGTARALAVTGIAAALGGSAALVLAGAGYRWGWWPLPDAFLLLRTGAAVAGGGAILSLLGAGWTWRRGMRALAALAFVLGVIGLAAATVPLLQLRTAKSVPRIHDITTDTANPPRFEVLLPARLGSPNGAEYGGDAIATQQRAAYPDIQPIRLDASSAEAFARARDAARAMGWAIAAEDPVRGMIEATDRTFWFGFMDDIVVRVQPEGAGSVVDVRSASRIGLSDVGTNARRIRAYRERLLER